MTVADSTFVIGGDLRVRRLGFGAMRLALWEPPADRPAAIAVARRAVELGVNLIDTADVYGLGASEELLADALHPYPSDLVIATKAGGCRPSPGEWVALGRPEYLRQQAELSLRRLRVDRIDLFQLHRIDPAVPLEDQLSALRQLQEEGKIRHIGLSEVTVAQLEQACALADVVSVQNLYNLADRRHEEVLQRCQSEGVAFLPWQPIGVPTEPDAKDALEAVAAEIGARPAQVSLAWLLEHSPVMLPIPGTTSLAHLEENVAARDLALSLDQISRLSTAAVPAGGK